MYIPRTHTKFSAYDNITSHAMCVAFMEPCLHTYFIYLCVLDTPKYVHMYVCVCISAIER